MKLLQYEKSLQPLLSALPVCHGWGRGATLYHYNGYWLQLVFIAGQRLLPEQYAPRPTDILLASSPKCGTTWLKALAFAALCRLLDRNPHDLVPFIELQYLASPGKLESLQDPRLLATHLPPSLLPAAVTSTCRIIYVYRDPKDVFVSHWQFGKSTCGPLWDHAFEYWRESRRSPERVLFLRYEDMAEDAGGSLRKIAEFMGRGFSPEEESAGAVEALAELCSFENLSKQEVNKTGNFRVSDQVEFRGLKNSSFFRKGKVGDSANYLSPEMARRLDEFMQEKLHAADLAGFPAGSGQSN
ncbi:Cytosolic sulfotransferase 16 [Apostasia shenzhenica]|uniref:Sulfotransferase n=1 Tax=Apostasia shenzhenica TaxID=1088818 RepID=A0A2I0AZG5_9ASPA|nr:Cytosolic sulfotransferase 16 [Apostasia shenzhenica]